jgi:hypothetical protein
MLHSFSWSEVFVVVLIFLSRRSLFGGLGEVDDLSTSATFTVDDVASIDFLHVVLVVLFFLFSIINICEIYGG